jgi:hypothetical protein
MIGQKKLMFSRLRHEAAQNIVLRFISITLFEKLQKISERNVVEKITS